MEDRSEDGRERSREELVPPGFFDWPKGLPWPLPPGWTVGVGGPIDVVEDDDLGVVAAYRTPEGEITRTASRAAKGAEGAPS